MKSFNRALLAATVALLTVLAVPPAWADDVSNGSYSTTDSSNNATPPNGWPAGMAPNQVEPTARANMGAVKRWWERANGALTSTGSAGAYAVTPSNATYPSAYAQGEEYCFKANFTSVGNDTLNYNGLGALSMYKASASGPTKIAAGDVQAGQIVCVYYDAALNSAAGGFDVLGGASGFSNSLPLSVANGGTAATTASGARTNLGLGASAVENLGATVADDGSGNLKVVNSGVSAASYVYSSVTVGADGRISAASSGQPNLQQAYLSSGNFTVPAGITPSTVFKFTVMGAGGGGGGVSATNGAAAGGGASGAYVVAYFSGFTAGQTLSISYGAAGTAGSSSGGNGGAGGNTTLTYGGQQIVLSAGGLGGAGSTSASSAAIGGMGLGTSSSVTAGTSGLTLVWSNLQTGSIPPVYFGGNGIGGTGIGVSGAGGFSPFGQGGSAEVVATNQSGAAAYNYGCGGGGAASSGTAHAGGAGGGGAVLIEWVQ